MPVLVLGSLNMDLVARAPHLPRPGETLSGSGFSLVPGGKGANQAVAAARAGASTTMFGRVGDDAFGRALVEGLRADGVAVGRVLADPSRPTGVASIVVGASGENQIVVVAGANAAVGAADVERAAALVGEGDVVLLQLEVPLETVAAAAARFRAAGAFVVLDPAPARDDLPPKLLGAVDLLTPNETEAAVLLGHAVQGVEGGRAAASALRTRGPRAVAVTLGAAGVAVCDGRRTWHQPPFPCTPVDSVAAGDAFNGAVAAALAEGRSLEEAVRRGAAAGALAAARPGAQPSLPTRAEIDALVDRCDQQSDQR